MMAKLYYFNGRGHGEIIRICLATANIPFTEELITEREQYLKLVKEGKLLFNQIPYLEIDGKQLTQSTAIVRYIGRKAGMYGQSEDEITLIEQLFEGARDFIFPSYEIGFEDEEGILSRAKDKTLPKYLPLFEKVLASNDTGFLVGDTASIADVALIEGLLVYTEYLGKEIMNDYPGVQKFFTTMTSLEGLSSYLSGPQRKPKKSQKYTDEVKRVLGYTA